MTITGMLRVSGNSCNRRSTSSPCISGRCKSSSIRSNTQACVAHSYADALLGEVFARYRDASSLTVVLDCVSQQIQQYLFQALAVSHRVTVVSQRLVRVELKVSLGSHWPHQVETL